MLKPAFADGRNRVKLFVDPDPSAQRKVPVPHLTQVEKFVTPVTVEYVPALQRRQVDVDLAPYAEE
jgi:hypothetical protein